MCDSRCSFLQYSELLFSSVLNIKFASCKTNGTMHGYLAALSQENHSGSFHSLTAYYVSATVLNLSRLLSTTLYYPISCLLVPLGS